MNHKNTRSIKKLILAQQKYKYALDHWKKAKEDYNKNMSLIADLKKQIKRTGYYSDSGIRVDMPFLPSSDDKVQTMIDLMGSIENKKIADLGCGDGKIILELAKRKADVYGYELEPNLAQKAHNNTKDYSENCHIIESDFFDIDLSAYEILTIYGINSAMKKLEPKVRKELKPDALVVSNTFPFPNWEPKAEKNNVYLYVKE